MNASNTQSIQDKITEAIRDNQDFLLLTHVHPDGDSLGSLVALRHVLTGLDKNPCVLFPGDASAEYRFIVAGEQMPRTLPEGRTWQVVFILDVAAMSRLPRSLSGTIPPGGQVINIDHHAGNAIQGDLNWVDPQASSVGEMLFDLFDRAGYPLSPEVATALYTAILADTGGFRFANTTPRSLRIAAELIERGAQVAEIVDQVYFTASVTKYRLLGEALRTLQTTCSGRVATMNVTQQMFQATGSSAEDTDGFVDYPRNLSGAVLAILFKEKADGQGVKVSLRSKTDRINVARIAAAFQGGGHPRAAACTLSGSIESVRERVLELAAREVSGGGSSPADSSSQDSSSKG